MWKNHFHLRYDGETKRNLEHLGCGKPTKKHRRKYRKVRRGALKNGETLREYTDRLLKQRAYERYWPQMKPGVDISIDRHVYRIAYRKGNKKVVGTLIGFDLRQRLGSGMHFGTLRRIRPYPHIQREIHWTDVAKRNNEVLWEYGFFSDIGVDADAALEYVAAESLEIWYPTEWENFRSTWLGYRIASDSSS